MSIILLVLLAAVIYSYFEKPCEMTPAERQALTRANEELAKYDTLIG